MASELVETSEQTRIGPRWRACGTRWGRVGAVWRFGKMPCVAQTGGWGSRGDVRRGA